MLRFSFFGICLFFLAFFALAPAFAQPLPDRMTLHGKAVDQEGKPIAGVYISVRRQNDMGTYGFWGGEARSDEAGNWEIPDAEEGAYYLNAEVNGFSSRTNVALDFQKNKPPVQVQMVRMVNLKLRFTASDGGSLASAPVFVRFQWIQGGDGGDISGLNMQNGRTDSSGIYQPGSLMPARYALYASSPEDGYYLNTALDISANSTQNDEPLQIPLQKGANLRARIADANGRAIGGALFSLAPVSDEKPPATTFPVILTDDYAILVAAGNQSLLSSRDGDGLVQLQNVPPGKYIARYVAPGLSATGNKTGDHAVRSVELKSGELTELSWTPTPKKYSALVLDVRTPNDKPYNFGEILVRILSVSGEGSIFGNHHEGENSFPSAGGTRRVAPDENGRATLYPLQAGRYRLFVSQVSSGAAKVKNAKTGEATASREVGPIDVTISAGTTPAGGSGTATVVLDEPK